MELFWGKRKNMLIFHTLRCHHRRWMMIPLLFSTLRVLSISDNKSVLLNLLMDFWGVELGEVSTLKILFGVVRVEWGMGFVRCLWQIQLALIA
jgi:hypothetical protein